MSQSTIFISYARIDGLEFARMLYKALSNHNIRAWQDENDIKDGMDWDREIDEALKAATAVVVVLTPGAVESVQVRSEWNFALNRMIPIFPFLVQNCNIPRVLSVFNYSDARIDPATSVRKFIDDFDSLIFNHIGQLAQQLAAFKAAKEEAKDPHRFNEKIYELERTLEVWESRIQTQRERIIKGLEKLNSHKNESYLNSKQKVRIAGQYLQDVTTIFKDRDFEQQELLLALKENKFRLVSIIGRGGIGKTAIASKILREIEIKAAARNEYQINGILYLSTKTSGITLERLFLCFAQIFDEPQRIKILNLWGEKRFNVREKIERLLSFLKEGNCVILLDNIEDLLDSNGTLKDAELQVFFDMVFQTPSSLHILLTSRIPLKLDPHTYKLHKQIHLQDGLPHSEAITLLRELDPNDMYGLYSASDSKLHKIVDLTYGVPRALELVVGILANDIFAQIDDILVDFYGQDEIVKQLVEENYRRLKDDARHILEALAVFKRPVPQVAIDYLLEPFFPGIDVPYLLRQLVQSHIVNADRLSKTVNLHPIDQEYSYATLPSLGPYNRYALEAQAASYYQKRHPPSFGILKEWKSIEDIETYLWEFEHYCLANLYDKAMITLQMIEDYLSFNGYASRVRLMLDRLDGQLISEKAKLWHSFARAKNMQVTGELHNSENLLKECRSIAEIISENDIIGYIHYELGFTYKYMNDLGNAIAHLQYSLEYARINKDEKLKCLALSGLILANSAARYLIQALNFISELKALSNNDLTILGLSDAYLALVQLLMGDYELSVKTGYKSLENYEKTNKYSWIIPVKNTIGISYAGLGDYDNAVQQFRQCLTKAKEEERPIYAARAIFNLAVTYFLIGKYEDAISVIDHTKDMVHEGIIEYKFVNILRRIISHSIEHNYAEKFDLLYSILMEIKNNPDLMDIRIIAQVAQKLASDVQSPEFAGKFQSMQV